MMGYGYGGYGPWSWGFGIIPMILMVIFWVAVIAGIVVLIRWVWGQTGRPAPPSSGGDTALDILKKRYARGEIEKEEFDRRRRDLEV